MLSMIIALILLLGVMTGIWFNTRDKSLRISLAISVGLHAVLFIRFFSGSEGFSAPVRNEILDFTFIPTSIEAASQDLPQLATIESVSGGVKFYGSKTLERRSVPADQKNSKPQPENPAKETAKTDLSPLEKIKWFDFNKHPQGASYRKEIHRLVHAHQVVPKEIVQKGWEAKIKVWFNLSRDGKLNSVYVDKRFGSSYDMINRASMQSVQNAAKYFPPLPEGVKNTDVWFNIILDYTRIRR